MHDESRRNSIAQCADPPPIPTPRAGSSGSKPTCPSFIWPDAMRTSASSRCTSPSSTSCGLHGGAAARSRSVRSIGRSPARCTWVSGRSSRTAGDARSRHRCRPAGAGAGAGSRRCRASTWCACAGSTRRRCCRFAAHRVMTVWRMRMPSPIRSPAIICTRRAVRRAAIPAARRASRPSAGRCSIRSTSRCRTKPRCAPGTKPNWPASHRCSLIGMRSVSCARVTATCISRTSCAGGTGS